jgi:hypothetical protein
LQNDELSEFYNIVAKDNTVVQSLLMHATNTIAAIVYEISNAKTDISLRRASTTPLKTRFG